jgi:hypothetical protein
MVNPGAVGIVFWANGGRLGSTQEHNMKLICFLAACLLAGTVGGRAAEIVEMTNGDRYAGTVVSVTSSNVILQSEVQGRIVLPRAKVSRLLMRETPATDIKPAPVAASSSTNLPSVATLRGAQAGASVDASKKRIEALLGQADPSAAAEFNKMAAALMTGGLTEKDLKVQAQAALKQVEELKKQQGGTADETLEGYSQMLRG